MKKVRMIGVEELALSLGVSVATVNHWYAYKRTKPKDELAKLLPEFKQEHSRAPRYWSVDDIWRLLEFKSKIVIGRNGAMGCITQKYVKN